MGSNAYIIAEIGVNHFDIAVDRNISPMEAAKLMIREAFKAGAHAAKFQSYKAETLVIKKSPAYWDTSEEKATSQYDLFKKYDHFSKDNFRELANYCKEIGIDFLSTPFDFHAVDYLDKLMTKYKIASADITNIPLLEKVCSKKKPMLLSTGASTLNEIRYTVDKIKQFNRDIEVTLLHCILSYPTNYEDANLNRILHLKKAFPECSIGYSDHTPPDKNMLVTTVAYSFGATIIEKHFTLNKNIPGNDHYHAMDSDDLRCLCKNISFLSKILSKNEKNFLKCEEIPRRFARRSIVAKRDLSSGTIISFDDLDFKRPGTGISPVESENIIGKRVKKDILEDSQLDFDSIE
ncbi:MAG: N-acetylneuraminate synthase family protein [Spirochaetales bacterium]|nr:N-acetylneuraminate synthase family protein [Spirochaetales bacterium]